MEDLDQLDAIINVDQVKLSDLVVYVVTQEIVPQMDQTAEQLELEMDVLILSAIT